MNTHTCPPIRPSASHPCEVDIHAKPQLLAHRRSRRAGSQVRTLGKAVEAGKAAEGQGLECSGVKRERERARPRVGQPWLWWRS